MDTLSPTATFLRVDDKCYPEFIDEDQELRAVPSLVYGYIFRVCRKTCSDRCWPSQITLAKKCKCSVRSIQEHLRTLTRLEYISIAQHEGHNVYILRLSDRVRRILKLAGVDTIDSPRKKFSSDTKVLHPGGAESAYYRRDPRDQNQNTPLPPISPLPKPSPSTTPVCSSSSCRRQGDGSPLRSEVGRGDSFSAQTEKQTHPAANVTIVRSARSMRNLRADEIQKQNTDFDLLWAAWPATAAWDMPRNRNLARRIFLSLVRAGQLPPIEEHLAVIERFKTTDSRWKNGYPPELSSWLRGRYWEKTPIVRSASSFGTGNQAPEIVPTLSAEQQRRLQELQQAYAAPLFSVAPASAPPALSADMNALCALWNAQTEPIAAWFGYRAKSGQTLDTSRLLTEARTYLAETTSPAPLLIWLRDYAARATRVTE